MPIEGFEEYYEISNMGRVKSLVRQRSNGKGMYWTKEFIKKPTKNRKYFSIKLHKENETLFTGVHRLLAIAFIDGRTQYRDQVNHIDGNPSNNDLSNLEWCSQLENNHHAIDIGLRKSRKSDSPNFKGVIFAIKDGVIYHVIDGLYSIRNIGFNHGKVYACVNGKRKHHKGFSFIRP